LCVSVVLFVTNPTSAGVLWEMQVSKYKKKNCEFTVKNIVGWFNLKK